MTEQGTREWFLERAGKFTASRMGDLTAKTKSGYSASRKNYLAELLIERMTGEPTEHFQSREMQRGIELEPEARALYELDYNASVDTTGFVRHVSRNYSGASPDGLVNSDGCIEIKSPNTATHIETIRTGNVPSGYYKQIQWVIECSLREWCDYISYDPRMKDERLVMYVKRIPRDEEMIAELRKEVDKAEEELVALVGEMKQIAEQMAS